MPRISTASQTLNDPSRKFHCAVCLTSDIIITFRRKYELNRHVKSVHEDPGRHECHWKNCNYASGQATNLTTHIKGHHSKGPTIPCVNAERGCAAMFYTYYFQGQHAKKCKLYRKITQHHSAASRQLQNVVNGVAQISVNEADVLNADAVSTGHTNGAADQDDSYSPSSISQLTSSRATALPDTGGPLPAPKQDELAYFRTEAYRNLPGPGYAAVDQVQPLVQQPAWRVGHLVTPPATPPRSAELKPTYDCAECVLSLPKCGCIDCADKQVHEHKPWAPYHSPPGSCPRCMECVNCYYAPGGCFQLHDRACFRVCVESPTARITGSTKAAYLSMDAPHVNLDGELALVDVGSVSYTYPPVPPPQAARGPAYHA